MIRKIDTGEFHLTTYPDNGSPYYILKEKRFSILKFRKRKIEKAPTGFSIKIEQQWRNGRTKSECMPFENFREKYLKDHTAIFLEGAHTLNFVLGFNKNGAFVPLAPHPADVATTEVLNEKPAKIKDFKVHFYYDLYF